MEFGILEGREGVEELWRGVDGHGGEEGRGGREEKNLTENIRRGWCAQSGEWRNNVKEGGW